MRAAFTVHTHSDPAMAPAVSPPSEQNEITPYRPDDTLPDTELFIRGVFADNPQEGCKLLFQLYYKPMCTHAVRFVYSKEIAEDLVSDVFYAFWHTQAFTSVNRSFRAYLFQSVRNRAYSYLASEFSKVTPLELADQQAIAPADSPESIMRYNELYGRIDELVAGLPPQCRTVFMLHRFEGKRAKEIADQLSLSIRTVEVHIAKALATIRNGLKNQWLIVALAAGTLTWIEAWL